MSDPFVVPVGRDFAPKTPQGKYGTVALDVVPISQLMEEGLERDVHFFVTHTMVDSKSIAKKDSFFLRNPKFGITIPCEMVEDSSNRFRRDLAEFYKISENLWQQFRHTLFYGPGPDKTDFIWFYNTTKLRMLKIEMTLKVDSTSFNGVASLLNRETMNTLPLHLTHYWSYRGTEQSAMEPYTGSEQNFYFNTVEEKNTKKVMNVWKDFIVVTKDNPRRIVVGIANDFHYATKNDIIHNAVSSSVDINSKVEQFAKKAYDLWRKGQLDYLILNGDMIDHLLKLEEALLTWNVRVHRMKFYDETNWGGFEKTIGLLGPWKTWSTWWSKALSNVPIIWNLGDHDRLVNPYPICPVYLTHGWTASGVYFFEESHYNFHNLSGSTVTESGVTQPLSTEYALVLAELPYINYAEQYMNLSWLRGTGIEGSHLEALRFPFERGRMSEWPLWIRFKIGAKDFTIICMDTGHMVGDFTPRKNGSPDWIPIYPKSPLTSAGLDSKFSEYIDTVVKGSDSAIIVTHAPPLCLEPTNGLYEVNLSPPINGAYGVFKENREAFLAFLKQRVADTDKKPTLVVSGHVHYRSAYVSRSPDDYRTGTEIWDQIIRLNTDQPLSGSMSPTEFWEENPCLLITNGPVGPRPMKKGQTSGFLLLHLEEEGVSKILWEVIE
jgi:hypothetical protein